VARKPAPTVKVEFSGTGSHGENPTVLIHDPEQLGPAVREQLRLMGITTSRGVMKGRLRGSAKTLTTLLETYGYTVEQQEPDWDLPSAI
jgi:hypothetical protein